VFLTLLQNHEEKNAKNGVFFMGLSMNINGKKNEFGEMGILS